MEAVTDKCMGEPRSYTCTSYCVHQERAERVSNPDIAMPSGTGKQFQASRANYVPTTYLTRLLQAPNCC